jgi:hypothetical protein
MSALTLIADIQGLAQNYIFRIWPDVRFQGQSRRESRPSQRSTFSQQRTSAVPGEVKHLSLTTLREKLIKIGAKIVRHGRYVTFQMAEVAVPPDLFREILRRIDELRPRPVPT